MNRRTLASISLLSALGLGGIVFAQDMGGMKMEPSAAPASQPSTQPSAATDLHNTVCPVSMQDVGSSKLTETYQGKTYHFCCDDCPAKFRADPDKYAKAVAADPAKYGVK